MRTALRQARSVTLKPNRHTDLGPTQQRQLQAGVKPFQSHSIRDTYLCIQTSQMPGSTSILAVSRSAALTAWICHLDITKNLSSFQSTTRINYEF
jgi:hypothetical protein